ncbi:MAG: NOL1/NOP2/sun family putative RNA methylase [Candidatus Thorarchaeota archaeon]
MKPSQPSASVYSIGEKYGYLSYMIERYVEILGEEETTNLLHFYETKLPKTIRLNSLRSSYFKTSKLLKNKGVELTNIPRIEEGKEVTSSLIPIGATPEYLNGYYFLQGKNSMYPSLILNPKKHELVGDFAAAPGGKTTHLAQLMENEGNIVALELSLKRCRSLKANLSRMGVKNTTIFQMDTREVTTLGLEFDKILLDAPCSGSGVISSDYTRKSSKTLDDIMNYHDYQTSLLSSSLEVLKPNGELVYCTCSLEPEENEYVISRVLENYDLELVEIDIEGDNGLEKFQQYEFHKDVLKTRRLYPHKTSGEGFFIAKMVKNR